MKYLMNAVAPVVIGAVLFLGPGSALAQRHIPRTDEQIKDQVEHKLSEMDVNDENVQVAVQNGIATLKGTLPSAWARQHAVDEALEVDDVQSVVSKLTVAAGESDSAVAADVAEKVLRYVYYTIYDDGVSGFDNQIRASVASRIYRHPLFLRYAVQADPPIHIVVENSRLTLVGVVDSEVDRRKAEYIARATFGVLGVKNELRVGGGAE